MKWTSLWNCMAGRLPDPAREGRKHLRCLVDLKVLVRNRHHEIPARLTDFSFGGLRLQLPNPIPLGDNLNVEAPGGPSLPCQVVYCLESGGKFWAGLRHLEPARMRESWAVVLLDHLPLGSTENPYRRTECRLPAQVQAPTSISAICCELGLDGCRLQISGSCLPAGPLTLSLGPLLQPLVTLQAVRLTSADDRPGCYHLRFLEPDRHPRLRSLVRHLTQLLEPFQQRAGECLLDAWPCSPARCLPPPPPAEISLKSVVAPRPRPPQEILLGRYDKLPPGPIRQSTRTFSPRSASLWMARALAVAPAQELRRPERNGSNKRAHEYTKCADCR